MKFGNNSCASDSNWVFQDIPHMEGLRLLHIGLDRLLAAESILNGNKKSPLALKLERNKFLWFYLEGKGRGTKKSCRQIVLECRLL